jgi:hypothetical protein
MLHLLCFQLVSSPNSVAGGAAFSYYQLNRADAEGRRKSEFGSGFRKIKDNCKLISALLPCEGPNCQGSTWRPKHQLFPTLCPIATLPSALLVSFLINSVPIGVRSRWVLPSHLRFPVINSTLSKSLASSARRSHPNEA